MTIQFAVTAPIFSLIAIGYLATRFGLIPREAIIGIGRFVLYFAVPALIFKALSEAQIHTILEPMFLTAYGAGCLATFLVIFLLFRSVMGKSPTESGLNGFGAALPNSIYVGFPVLLALFDTVPVAAFSMALLIENVLIFPLALTVMEMGAGEKDRPTAGPILKTVGQRLITNPILLAIAAGLCASAIELTLPETPSRVIGLLAKASPAAALFFIGDTLVGSTIKGEATAISIVAFGKLVINPAFVTLFIVLLPDFDPDLQLAAIVIATAPMLAIYPVIGAKYGLAQQSASKLLFTTAASFVTISIALRLVMG